jgi:membrane protein involved in colicin uptake
MKSRYLVLFLSVVLALALAVPALGGPTNPIASISATVKQTATKALKIAKSAKKIANSAQSTANSAQSTANSAQSTANSASTAAKNAQTTANSASTAAKNAQTTANTAVSAAAAAKAAADAAQATANTKLGETFTEFGSGSGTKTTSGSDFAECPGNSEVTGGGFEVSGTGANEVVPTFAASYGDAWLTVLQRIPGQADSWSVRASVVCAQ